MQEGPGDFCEDLGKEGNGAVDIHMNDGGGGGICQLPNWYTPYGILRSVRRIIWEEKATLGLVSALQ